MSLPVRNLGRNGPEVNAVGLGFMSLGGIYGSRDSLEHKVSFLEHAHAAGQRFWDTADMYLDSEDAVGEWVKRSGNRNDIFIATKFGIQYDPSSGDYNLKIRSDPEYVREACEKSLKRLNTTIDLYYCHRIDGVTPIEKTIKAMVELKNAFATDIEWPTIDLLNTCRELGIAVVAYSPIGRGVLSGQIKTFDDLPENDFRRGLPKYALENFPNIVRLTDGFNKVAQAHGRTSAQVAIAWLLAQGLDIIPIPGTRSTSRMDENNAAVLVKLTEHEVQELRELVDRTEIPGQRYSGA
ncbi:Aldo-keto reductase yakc [NADP(+)] [Penicillium subrubescens]|uniref:Aldo-keto reductase yakc [NADP(+)] n=1 Tax=Penicillium subrubescens TaxID=1316194 RepID=A0A1Q5UF48_9EURO|nr:Aldo-keto reductase yakc [NADP(+)] [Penicillium subrubescens]